MNAKWLSALTLIVVMCGASLRVDADAKNGEDYCFEAMLKLRQYYHNSKALNEVKLLDAGLEGVRVLLRKHGVVWAEPGIHPSNTATTARLQFVAKMRAAIARGADCGATKEAIAFAAASALVAAVRSSHCVLLSASDTERWLRYNDGFTRYGGIGATLVTIDGMPFLMNVLPGGAAAGSGIAELDRVVEVNGEVVASVAQAKRLLYGASGTVRVRVMRKFVSYDCVIHRSGDYGTDAWVALQHVTRGTKRMSVMRLRAFTMNDATIVETMRRAIANDKLDGIVIDLRANPGGSGAIVGELASLFLEEGKPIFVGACPSRNETAVIVTTVAARGGAAPSKIPLRILVGPGTHCAAEIFAYAMQQYGRARLIGALTPGTVEGRDDIHLESGPMLCVGITSIVMMDRVVLEGRGVRPDCFVPLRAHDALQGRDSQLEAALDELTRECK